MRQIREEHVLSRSGSASAQKQRAHTRRETLRKRSLCTNRTTAARTRNRASLNTLQTCLQ